MRSWLFLVGAWCSCAVAWGTITWGEPRDVTGDADVNTNGVQVYAYSWRYTNIDRILVNGEEFVPGGSSRAAGVDISAPGLSVWEASTSGNCVRNWSSNQVATATCSANYLHCLSAPIHGQASDVSLKNLVPGRTYEVQLWSSSCFPESAGRTILLDGTRSVSMNVGTAAEPKLGQHVTGRFVAGADGVETFHLADPSSNNVKWAPLNMIQLRDVTETPVISWTVGDIQADTDVATEGRLLYAYTESGEATTVNGVPFAAGNSQTPQSLPGPNEGTADCFFPEIVSCAVSAFSSSNLSDAYAKVVKGGIYRDQVSRDLVLRGLEIGRSYLVQLWVNDSRSGIILRRIILDGACSLQYRRENGNGQYAIGRFRASARTQRIRMTLDPSLSNQSFQLNAIQVRALDTDGIQWTSAATTSESDVLTEGTCVYAYTWYTNALTVGGVSFASALNSAASVGTLGDITAVGFLNVNTYIDYQPYAEEKGASATLHDFLRFGLYSQVVRGAQLQLHHLTPGVSYAVQLFVADGRSAGSTSSRAVRVDGMERLPHGTTSRPLGSFAVGRFVARAADVTIPLQPYGNLSITGSDLSCQVNAIQVRRLGEDASCGEPTAWTVADVAAATDVSTEGTLLYAYTPASGGVTVNGVAFANASFSRDIGTNVRMSNHPTSFYSGFATSYPGSLTDSAYLKLLGNGNYLDSTFNETTVTLGNLTAGHAYLVQVWVNDLRPGDGTGRFWYADRDTSRKIYYKTGGANAGQHAIGRFTATGSERTFTMTFPNKNAQLNALQVRDLGLAMAGFAPEGTSLVLNDAVETNALIVTSSLTVTGTGTLNASNGVLGGTCVLNVPWGGRDLVTGGRRPDAERRRRRAGRRARPPGHAHAERAHGHGAVLLGGGHACGRDGEYGRGARPCGIGPVQRSGHDRPLERMRRGDDGVARRGTLRAQGGRLRLAVQGDARPGRARERGGAHPGGGGEPGRGRAGRRGAVPRRRGRGHGHGGEPPAGGGAALCVRCHPRAYGRGRAGGQGRSRSDGRDGAGGPGAAGGWQCARHGCGRADGHADLRLRRIGVPCGIQPRPRGLVRAFSGRHDHFHSLNVVCLLVGDCGICNCTLGEERLDGDR